MKDGFIKIATASPMVSVADCDYNCDRIIECVFESYKNGASLVAFPELSLTGYTCGDLFYQDLLIASCENALKRILDKTKELDIVIVLGMPVRCGASLFNCATVIKNGQILGCVPKKNIPSYNEFYETRYFKPAFDEPLSVTLCNQTVNVQSDVVFSCIENKYFKFAVEICEDLWVPLSPSVKLCSMGANLIINLSASDDVIGKADYRRDLVKLQSAKNICTYAYVDCSLGESTTDMVFSGQNIIYENGTLLAESKRFENGITYAETDLLKIENERRKMNTYSNNTSNKSEINTVSFSHKLRDIVLSRKFEKNPFVPTSKYEREKRCEEIIKMQATGLLTRLMHTGIKNVVLGLSGGLDSTLALIVCVKAFDMLGLPRENILSVTMPCFGTTDRTKSNAYKLAKAYKTSFMEVNITGAVLCHFRDIEHSTELLDTTFENSQARERTQVLMDLANKNNALVVGTGDLSELALGFATYNGDHMSMYAVNASIPKTLVRYLTLYEAESKGGELSKVLLSVLDTPVSPELLPHDKGKIMQKTEEIIGPYELHDFFLYYFVRYAFSPTKILRLAKIAFDGEYSEEEIKKWLRIFIKRFFSQQFKRSCLPDGPKVGSVTLSPRSDFRMPSDANVSIWLKSLE